MGKEMLALQEGQCCIELRTGWLVGWLVGWLADWFAGWLVGWQMVGWLVRSFVG
jgi:F0F1-type ATP synthase assembly protein I